jgi:outer membrane protein assembly factor BamB
MFSFSKHRVNRRRISSLILALVVLAGIVACTSDDPAPTPVRTTVEKVWTAAGIDPVSAVDNIGGVAVVYGTVPDGLMIYGLDPTTGTILWSRPAAILSDALSNLWVWDLDGAVAYFRPTGTDRVAQLVLADPTTGRDLTVSAARYWAGYPGSCDVPADGVCLYSYIQTATGRWGTQQFRVNRTTGTTGPVDRDAPAFPDDGTALPIADLYYFYPEGRDDTSIGRAENGVRTWSRAATDVFGPDLDRPHWFYMSEPLDLDYTVMTALDNVAADAPSGLLDLAKDVSTTAFSLNDGATTWSAPGAWFGCAHSAFLAWDRNLPAGESAGYLCRYSGTATYDKTATGDPRLVTNGLNVTLERIDPATGKATWSTDLGDAKSLAADSTGGESAALDDDHLFVPNSAGGVVVDLESGETRAPTLQDIFWCQSAGTFTRPEPYFTESSPITSTARLGLVRSCRADGADADVPSTAIPSEIGSSFDGDLRVIAMPGGVSGFLTPPIPPASTATTPTTTSPSDTTAPATDSSSAAPPADPVLDTVEQVRAATGFEPRTTPKIIGGTAVLYATVGMDLILIGLDPATGAERWRRSANASMFNPSTEVRVVEIDGLVAYLRPDNPQIPVLSAIVLIDPAAGTDMIATDTRLWIDFPEICADDQASLCAPAYDVELDNTLTQRRLRINRQDAGVTLIPEAVNPDSSPYTTLWNDVVTINGAPTPTLGIVKDDVLVWSKPLAELLGPDATLDRGWYASEDDGATPILELAGRIGWKGDGTTYPSLDLANNLVTVGINRDDGSVVWRQIGTSPMCRHGLKDRRFMSTPGSQDPTLRCVYTGRLDSNPPGRDYGLTVPTDLTVTLERVDLQTGKALWSVPVGAAASLATAANGLTTTFLDDHRLLVGGTVIDVDTGITRAPATGETFWCPAPQSFDQSREWFGVDGSVRVDRRAEGEVFLCDANAQPANGLPTAVPLAVAGVSDNGLRLVSTPAGVIAYRVPL